MCINCSSAKKMNSSVVKCVSILVCIYTSWFTWASIHRIRCFLKWQRKGCLIFLISHIFSRRDWDMRKRQNWGKHGCKWIEMYSSTLCLSLADFLAQSLILTSQFLWWFIAIYVYFSLCRTWNLVVFVSWLDPFTQCSYQALSWV